MKTLWVLVGFCISSAALAADINVGTMSTDMVAFTRSMDLLMARQEMKDALPPLQSTHWTGTRHADSEASRKVALLTDPTSIKSCVVDSKEQDAPDGSKKDAVITYKGEGCPFDMQATVHMASANNTVAGTVEMDMKIVSPSIQSQFEIDQMILPIKITAGFKPTPGGGFGVDTDMNLSGQIHSLKLGTVNYVGDLSAVITLGSSMGADTRSDEVYSTSSQKEEFLQTSTLANGSQVNNYEVDGQVVTKAVFDQKHQSISIPGFDIQPTALEVPHTCRMVTYDPSKYSLDQVRQAIQNGTIDSLVAADLLSPVSLTQTGKIQSVLNLQGQAPVAMEVQVSQDAARFDFASQDPMTGAKQDLGKITAVLGAHVDLSKLIGNRVMRITCEPNS